jgi:hypothetical protein
MSDSQRQSDRAGNGVRTAWSDSEASRFVEQIGTERLTLAKQRFDGADPTVRGPSGKSGPRLVARILAADREGALVLTGDTTINPAEDRAEASLQRAIGAATRWQFDVASRELGEVSALSRSPVRQQRASLIQAMLRLVRALVWTTPGERLRPEDSAARTLLRRLDVLSHDEIEHYRAEVERLTGHWRAAAGDDEVWRAWALLRGRIAMRDGADESMLAWALRAWDRQPEPERHLSAGLAQILEGARLVFAELAGQPKPEDAPDPPHPRDVLLAVAGTLAAQTGDPEPFSMTNRYALVRWHEPPTASGEESPL